MPRNLVLCLDGTGNTYGDRLTHVVRLYELLPRADERQLAYYDPGLGTLAAPAALTRAGRALTRLAGLAFGYGLSRALAEAYRFLMARYARGDRVFLFGFSRGAYTARALAALVARCGLLPPGSENLVPHALRLFRRGGDPRLAAGFRRTFARRCSIHFLGLWDTVKSIGWIYDPLRLPFTQRNRIVRGVRHAVALDERRCFYRQHLWGEPLAHQDVRQVWFAGVHGDVGGGYPEQESALAQVPFAWMVREATAQGLLVDEGRWARRLAVHPADPCAPAHRSLRGLWWLPELLPKRYEDPRRGFAVRFRIPLGERRFVPEGTLVHASVAARRADPALGYRPPNLPASHTVVE